MGLASVLQTALSGISVAQVSIDVTANNLANAQTDGFKESRAVTATQSSGSQSVGSGPSGASGGSNPVQIGSGVQTVAIQTDFSQGSITITANPTDAALQGDGFFIIEGDGEQLYTRNGNFRINSEKQLVTASGERALGFSADENFEIDDTQLSPLSIPLGKTFDDGNGGATSLTSFSITGNGTIVGKLANGQTRDLGQIQVVRFANSNGLEERGQNAFATGVNSGLPVTSAPGENGSGALVSGAIEQSNVDIGRNLVSLVLAETQFKANAVVFNTADSLLDELLNLGR